MKKALAFMVAVFTALFFVSCADATWYIKNISFFDDSGNEIVPDVGK